MEWRRASSASASLSNILYYAFAKFEHPKKNLIIGVWLGALVLEIVFMMMGGAMNMHTVQ